MDLTLDRADTQQLPTDFHGWQSRGIYLQVEHRYEEAAFAFHRCIELDPDAVSAWSNLALAYRGMDRYPEALRTVIHATRLDPEWHVGWINLATLCGLMGLYEQGVDAARCAVKLRPERASTWGVLGNSLRLAGQLQDAVLAYDRGLEVEPDQASLNWNRAEVVLMLENWQEGFEVYEWRHRRPGYTPPWWGRKLWQGEKISGTLLLHTEQGFGDTLQFLRFLKHAKERVGRLVIRCHPRLKGLLEQLDVVDAVVSKRDAIPVFDKQHYLMSVPYLMGAVDVQTEVPYLNCRLGQLPEPLRGDAQSGGMRIGLGWQGNPEFGRDHLRSIPLRRFAPLSTLKDVTLYSLQKGDGAAQIPECGFPIVNLSDVLDGGDTAFVDTIEAMKALDLIVTTDTSLAHLAGALGVEVWVLLSYAPDWRWGLESSQSNWYPTMRLFRQTEPLDWAEVMERVAGAIQFRQFQSRWGGEIASLDLGRSIGDRVRP